MQRTIILGSVRRRYHLPPPPGRYCSARPALRLLARHSNAHLQLADVGDGRPRHAEGADGAHTAVNLRCQVVVQAFDLGKESE